MWRCEQPSADLFPDVKRFLDLLNTSNDFFETNAPVYIARAPGRLDVMGGIADYSGSLVLELPLAVATLVAVQQTTEPLITIWSTTASEIGGTPLVTIPLQTLCPPDKPLDYAAAHRLLTTNPESIWAAYVAGALVVLQKERHFAFPQGIRMLVHCEVPIGKGISSSAALEVATMQAICALSGSYLDGRDLAMLCQKVENVIVGAPCGVMDQMTSACGISNHLLSLLCQPAELQDPLPLPEGIEIWGLDSGIRHAVTGSDYGGVRVGAFMGYRIIAEKAGLTVKLRGDGYVEVADPLWNGYLANMPPSVWEMGYRDYIPEKLSGAAFLEQYGGSTDLVTHIDPERVYAVRQPTAHPIYEHHRVRLFRSLLDRSELNEEHLQLLGELMYQSHASYSACGLGSGGTDRLIEMVSQAGPKAGLYGAKITGGGSGGTVAILARRGAQEQVQQIAARYEQETGRQVSLLSGSSSGAVTWGALQLSKG